MVAMNALIVAALLSVNPAAESHSAAWLSYAALAPREAKQVEVVEVEKKPEPVVEKKRLQCVILTMDGCPPCRQMERAVKQLCDAGQGWKQGDEGHFLFVPRGSDGKIEAACKTRLYPAVFFVVKQGDKLDADHFGNGYHDATMLAKEWVKRNERLGD